MAPQEVEEWMQDYENAQAWAHEENLNQRRREGKKMAYDQKDNEVTLWKQEKKSEKSPSYSGKGLVNGKEVRAALWNNTIQSGENKGETYLKLKFSDPQDNGSRPTEEPDIPF
mgnify:CR=1 FL=1